MWVANYLAKMAAEKRLKAWGSLTVCGGLVCVGVRVGLDVCLCVCLCVYVLWFSL